MADMRRFGPARFPAAAARVAAAAAARAGYLLTCRGQRQAQGAGPLRRPRGQAATEQDADRATCRRDFRFASRGPVRRRRGDDGPRLAGLPVPGRPAGQLRAATTSWSFTVRWIQVGLGALTAAFYFLFARRAFRSLAVGTLAGLFAALHPFWVVEVANIDDGTLASFALALCLLLASQAGEKGGALTSLLLGGSLAGLALVRAAYLPFAFVMLVWFLLRSRTLRLGWLCALCAFLGFGAALAPWTVRNYQEFNEPVPVVTSTYLHLWVGNNPKATGGPATEEMSTNGAGGRAEGRSPASASATTRLGPVVRGGPATTQSDRPAAAERGVVLPLRRALVHGRRRGGGAEPPASAGRAGVAAGAATRSLFTGVLLGDAGAGVPGLALELRLALGVDAGGAGDDVGAAAVHPGPRRGAVRPAAAAGRRAAVLRGVRAVLCAAKGGGRICGRGGRQSDE